MRLALFLLILGTSLSYATNLFDAEEEVIISPKLHAIVRNEEDVAIDNIDHEMVVDGDDSMKPDTSDSEEDIMEEDNAETDDDDVEEDESDENDDDLPTDEDDSQISEVDEEDDDDEDELDIEGTEDEHNSDDLCADVTCKKGKECMVIEGEAHCQCIMKCPSPIDDSEKVCGTNNQTYSNDCELWRTRCLYKRDKVSAGKHLRIDYYGPCKKIPLCKDEDMSEFSTRMRLWLKTVFLQLYDEEEGLDGGLNEQQRYEGGRLFVNKDRLLEFEEKSIEERNNDVDVDVFMSLYAYPVQWKFLELDVDPADKYLSRDELEPLLATLIPLEPCTKKFFKDADSDKDHLVSLYEWAVALGLKEENMDISLEV